MQKLLSFIFFIVFISLNVNVQAQITIEKSTNIVQDIDGNNFYLHHVAKGQTLYAISKAYGVKVDEIIVSNPDTKNGLKEGQDIKIPITKTDQPKLIEEKPIAPKGFLYHQVAKGETLYRIMFNYQITLPELQKYNDGLNSNIQVGQWILIPSVELRKAEQAASLYDSVVDYKLRKRDNYYRLEKKFKINQQQIEQLNPTLKTSGLQKDLIIKVPFLHDDFKVPEYADIVLDSVKPKFLMENAPEQDLINCSKINHNRHVYKIGFMIPIYANLDSEIDVDNDYKIKKQNNYKSFRFIQFVQGAKLALDSLSKLGFKAEVYFWDTQASERKTDSICNLTEFKQLDLLIGPFYSKNVQIARKASVINNIKMVDLFGKHVKDTIPNPGCFLIKTDEQNNYNSLVKYISDSVSNYRISILHQGHNDELARLELLKKSLYSNYLNIDTNKIFIYKYQDGGLNKIINSLSPTETSIIFNLVDDEARISNFLRQLNLKKKDNKIMVVAQDKYWNKYKTLELEYLSNLNYTFSTDYYICNNDSNHVIPFQNKFYETYKRMPQKMGFLGYDVSWYFGNALYYYGGNFSTCLQKFKTKTMHNSIYFKQLSEGIYMNTNVNVIQYDNYQEFKKN